MKLKLANSLSAGIARLNSLLRYFLWIAPGRINDIIQEEDDSYSYNNYGSRESEYNVAIQNIQVATFDGAAYLELESGSFTGITIIDYEGTSTPTVDYENDRITITAGALAWIEFSNGEIVYFNAGNGNIAYGLYGINANFIITYDELTVYDEFTEY